jgi:hypothetical protein
MDGMMRIEINGVVLHCIELYCIELYCGVQCCNVSCDVASVFVEYQLCSRGAVAGGFGDYDYGC